MQDSPALISVVLPVYNEGDNIAQCLRGLEAALAGEAHEVLVCYDDERDTTLTAIAAMPDAPASVRPIKNDLGRGALCAIRAGFAAARGDAVVTVMADLSDPPEVIVPMVRKLRDGAAVVSGSRYMPGGTQQGGPKLKSALSRLAGLSLHHLAGLGTHDATTNFRGYRRDFLQSVEIESTAGFELALELTVKAHLQGLTVDEVPSHWRERVAGSSRFRLLEWLPSYLRWYFAALRPVLARVGLVFGWLLAGAFTTLATVPFSLEPVSNSLDPSWRQALNVAVDNGARFGTDIVFTYGPLGFVRAATYWPSHAWVTIGFALALWGGVVTAGFPLVRAALERRRVWPHVALLWAAVVLSAMWSNDTLVTLLHVLIVWRICVRRDCQSSDMALFALVGVLSLAKLSFLVAGALAVGASTLALATTERPWRACVPPATSVLGFLLCWVATGQVLGDLGAFALNSVEIVSGYDQAMSKLGRNPVEAQAFCVLALLPLLSAGGYVRRARSLPSLIAAGFSAAVLLMALKQGFTRHDGHAVSGYAVLAMVHCLLTMLVSVHDDASSAPGRAWSGLRIVPMLVSAVVLGALATSAKIHAVRPFSEVAAQLGEQLRVNGEAVLDILEGSPRAAERHAAAYRGIAIATPLPPLMGTVDIYSFDQAVVFAHGLKWRPRPVFQSYAAYTRKLAELNAQHLASPRAADHLLFTVQPLDERLAALDDGASWIAIAQHYELRDFGPQLVLDRAAAPRRVTRTALGRREATGWVEVGSEASQLEASFMVPRSLSAVLPPSLGGRMLWIDLRLRSGEVTRRAFIPGAAEAPILLSPLLQTTSEFASWMHGCQTAMSRRAVAAVRIVDARNEPVAFTVSLTAVELQPPERRTPPSGFTCTEP